MQATVIFFAGKSKEKHIATNGTARGLALSLCKLRGSTVVNQTETEELAISGRNTIWVLPGRGSNSNFDIDLIWNYNLCLDQHVLYSLTCELGGTTTLLAFLGWLYLL
ncbi:hypothetical protein F0562_007096 [Nyssa sinensis]|uniref:Uncharacterized protein n=1 Tax=Nyssa sinensis TaxID=561372 RepID=A0A5J5A744_9ASTE|nr:hypothetical protein F0562_007096 [Nyssa sinensis]